MRPFAGRSLLLALVATGCVAASANVPVHPTAGVVRGSWHGTRRAAADGSVAPLRLRVRPLLGGRAFLEELEVEGEPPYSGVHVLLHEPEGDRWVRHYANAVRGRFTRLEGTREEGRTVWRNVTPERTRESRLVEVFPAAGLWRRTQEVSTDGGVSWSVLFVDELEADDRYDAR